MGASLFLSYTRADEHRAAELAEHLQRAGISIPLLYLHSQPGDYWTDTMRQSLREADAIVVLLSDAAAKNMTVMSELGAALAIGKRIILVHASDGPLPFSFSVPNVHVLQTFGLDAATVADLIGRIVSK